MKKRLLLSTIALVLSGLVGVQTAFAQTPGPFQNRGAGLVAPKIALNWFENLTFGSINTFIGAVDFTVFAVSNVIDGKSIPKLGLNSQQITVDARPRDGSSAYSVGIFNIGGRAEDHEAGHSHQSAVLGPFYLPTVVLDYETSGYGHSVVERWADLEAKILRRFATTVSVKTGVVFAQRDGQQLPVWMLSVAIEDRGHETSYRAELTKIYEWLKTEIYVPTSRSADGSQPFSAEFDIVRKTVNFETLPFASTPFGDAGVEFHTEQRYGTLQFGQTRDLVNEWAFSIARWAGFFGMTFNTPDRNVKAFVEAGFNAGVGSELVFQDRLIPFSLGLGVNGRAGVNLFKSLTLQAVLEKRWNINTGIVQSKEAFQITNRYRNPDSTLPDWIQRLDIDFSIENRHYRFPAEDFSVLWAGFTGGWRF